MSQPKHLRAPATPASAPVAQRSSVLLEDWTSLSPCAVPLMAPAAITREPARARGSLLARLSWARRFSAV